MGSSNSPDRGQVRSTPARSIDEQESLLQQGDFRGDGPRAARPEEFRDRGQQVSEQDE